MFRPMRRFKQQLDTETCESILTAEKRGVLALSGDDGYPYAIPVNYWYDAVNHQIIFHSAKEGHKIDAIQRSPKASFCVHDQGEQVEGDWSYIVRSVICFGQMRLVSDPEEAVALARPFAQKYYPTPEEAEAEIRKDGHRVQILTLTIEHMTGKRVHEK